MDICLDVGEYKLNLRAAGVIIHNGKVLLHKRKEKTHYVLLGGRIAIGENSQETVKREILEEIGKEVEVTDHIATIENFFSANGIKYHEIMFVYKAEFKNEEDKLIETTLKNVEGKDSLQYEWIEINKIDEYELLPKVMKSILKEGKIGVHKINNELE